MSGYFRIFFFVKKLHLAPMHMNRQKRFREIFRFRQDIREKRVSAYSCQCFYRVESFKEDK